MKKTTLLLAGLCLCSFLFAQNYKITWGDEIKMKKGTTDLEIVSADNTGLYFTDAQLKRSYFGGASESHKLMKVDNNFSEVFDKEYKKELKGVDFHSFQALGNDLYMFATDYTKKDKLFKAYGAKIDKNSGDLVNDFIELGSYPLESSRDDYQMKLTAIQNGKAFLMVANISGKDRVSLGVSVLDKNFIKKENTVINLSFDPGHFALQDVQYTSSSKIVLLGKEFTDEVYGKRNKKRTVFKQYVMMVYNNKGVKENDIPMSSGDRFVISGRLIEQASGDLLLAGFYSNSSKKEDLNGFFINKIDPLKGQMLLSSFKEINSGMLGKSFDDASDNDDETLASKKDAEKAKDDEDAEELPNSFIIKSVNINPADNSVIITSEVSRYEHYSYFSNSYNSMTRSNTSTLTTVHRFINQDILIINADKDGNIKWLNDLPKAQLEEIRVSNTDHGFGSFNYWVDYSGYFATGGGIPYYSSFTSLLSNNNLVLILNDHTSNTTNPGYGDKVRTVFNFRKRSNTYGISIDLATGKMNRKFIASNSDETILMPRHAMIVGNEVYIPSWRQHLMAKTELKFAKITVK